MPMSDELRRIKYRFLLVDPALDRTLISQNFTFLEPQGNFLFGTLDRVATMADIATNILRLLA